MIPLVVFSLLVAGLAAQHPAHVEFDPNTIISQLHAQFPTEAPVVELPPPVRGMPQRPIQPVSFQRPIQQRLAHQQAQKPVDFQPVHLQAQARPIAQLPGHLVNQMARIQVAKPGPHRFSSPKSKATEELIKKWEGPFAHEFGAGVKGPVEHTQFTPEVAAAHKFLTQAHVNHFRQKQQIDSIKAHVDQPQFSSGGRAAAAPRF